MHRKNIRWIITKQLKTEHLLGANNLSGFVARKLSGYNESHKGGFHETGTSTTGDSENGI